MLPEVALLPLQPEPALQLLALVAFQVSVAVSPVDSVDGDANIEIVGAGGGGGPAFGGVTVTVAEAVADGGGREKGGPVWGRFHMLRRMGDAIEVARPTLFLLSEDASFITGTSLMVDGGYLAMGPEGLGELSAFAGSD